ATCLCARYEAKPTEKHLKEVKRIFHADYAGCKDTLKSTSGGAQFLGEKLEHVEKGTIELYFVKTDYQLADIFTTALPTDRFNYLVCHLEISSSSTTTHLDISLSEYEAFYDDHVKVISSGSPTTHSDSSLYASFIFDLSINPFPPADRSDSYEFTDELILFISAPEYDCFLFKVEPNLRDFTKDVVKDISPIKELQVLNTLPTHPTLQLNMKF
nr:uncharacterized mitochondrial protein AtMg00810-like [Tanacetum cinerariifolium]